MVSENRKKAELLNNQVQSVFTKEDMSTMPYVPLDLPQMPDITSFVERRWEASDEFKPKQSQATSPDGISPRLLKEFAHEIAPVLILIYQRSIDTGILPLDWKQANISLIFKKDERSRASNYRPVSLTSVT